MNHSIFNQLIDELKQKSSKSYHQNDVTKTKKVMKTKKLMKTNKKLGIHINLSLTFIITIIRFCINFNNIFGNINKLVN